MTQSQYLDTKVVHFLEKPIPTYFLKDIFCILYNDLQYIYRIWEK